MLSSIHREEMPDDVVDALRSLKLRHPTEPRPYHDRWDSFPAERDWLFAEMGESSSEVVVLSGDVHIAVDADLESGGTVVAHEWTTSSITSQNLADKKGWAKNVESLPIVGHLVDTFPDLHWVDTDSHGFLVVTVDGGSASCEWWSLDTVARAVRRRRGRPHGHAHRRDRGRRLSMRVLVAPDKFAGTLTAVEAAEAIAAGWRRPRPDDELDLAPMADGGPGLRRRAARGARRRAARGHGARAARRPDPGDRPGAPATRRTSRARRPAGCT